MATEPSQPYEMSLEELRQEYEENSKQIDHWESDREQQDLWDRRQALG